LLGSCPAPHISQFFFGVFLVARVLNTRNSTEDCKVGPAWISLAWRLSFICPKILFEFLPSLHRLWTWTMDLKMIENKWKSWNQWIIGYVLTSSFREFLCSSVWS
jgi:hypothetical protein